MKKVMKHHLILMEINKKLQKKLLYNLNQISYFKSVNLKSTTEDKDKGVQKFSIELVLKEGAVHGK